MNTQKRLYRSTQDRMFAGVCGGIADYLDVDPTLVRLVFVALAFFGGGAGIFIYIVLMLIVPEQPPEQAEHLYESGSKGKHSVVRSSVPEPADIEEATPEPMDVDSE